MPVGDDGAARADADDRAEVTPDPAMVLLGRAMQVIAMATDDGLPADGRLPAGVDVTVAALDEWIRALTQTATFLVVELDADTSDIMYAGRKLIEKYGGA